MVVKLLRTLGVIDEEGNVDPVLQAGLVGLSA